MFDDNFGLTAAVLSGRKTMTRRLISCQVCQGMLTPLVYNGVDVSRDETVMKHSRYKIGDIVAIAQSYQAIHEEMMKGDYGSDIYADFRNTYGLSLTQGWSNKMFVRADLMPHQIRIAGIKVERLQDISDEDCMKEGIRKLESSDIPTHFTFDGWMFNNRVFRCADTPREAFSALFNKLSGKGAWDKNPWAFAYEFELYRF